MERRERPRERERPLTDWHPRTQLGRLVQSGRITSLHDALDSGLPMREPEVVDTLLPGTVDEVLKVNMVQRMTDSGRRVRFMVVVVIGNSDGFVGVGTAKVKEVGPAIRRAIEDAKVNILEVKRGCGSWECGCGTPHSLPLETTGQCGSVRVTFRPAPRGVGLAVGPVARHVLRLAGVQDAWGFARGKTRTTVNYALAAYDALVRISGTKIRPEQERMLKIVSGAVGVPIVSSVVEGGPKLPPEVAEAAKDTESLDEPTPQPPAA